MSTEELSSTKTPPASTSSRLTLVRSTPGDTTFIQTDPHYTSTKLDNFDLSSHRGIFILGGSVGFVLLVITGLSVFVGVLYWKRGSPSNILPPPIPHQFRRVAPDAVLYRVSPPEHQDRGSVITIQSNVYDEIPGDNDSSTPDDSIASVDSLSLSRGTTSDSSMSDSSMSDGILHHIACPSSESSLSDDYLHPTTPYKGTSATNNTAERLSSDTSSSSEAVMYS
ncbi:uncharacterized protein [Littorina saxatilis]|uniref:uncharacterized protein n=1 Tax=Littorina saxatilis TaxID=31220 RepID=UPI0038B55991